MGALRGAFVGSLGLVTLYNLIDAGQNGNKAGVLSAASLPGKLAHYIVSPDVPLIPDRTVTSTSAGSSNALDPGPSPSTVGPGGPGATLGPGALLGPGGTGLSGTIAPGDPLLTH